MRAIFGALLAATLLPAGAQAPAPAASPAEQPAKPRAPLKLQLDEADMRSLITLTPKDDEKKQDSELPTLGGKPSPVLERKASDVVPKDLTPGH